MLHAFPTPKEALSTGMSLRDYMATAIFSSMIQSKDFNDSFEAIAFMAYEFADALLRARENNQR